MGIILKTIHILQCILAGFIIVLEENSSITNFYVFVGFVAITIILYWIDNYRDLYKILDQKFREEHPIIMMINNKITSNDWMYYDYIVTKPEGLKLKGHFEIRDFPIKQGMFFVVESHGIEFLVQDIDKLRFSDPILREEYKGDVINE